MKTEYIKTHSMTKKNYSQLELAALEGISLYWYTQLQSSDDVHLISRELSKLL